MDLKEWMSEDFLEVVYGKEPGWIDLPSKFGEYWIPFHTEWPNDGPISKRIDTALRDGEDLYYSVTKFRNRGRRIEDVLPSHWLWADLDDVHPTEAAKLHLAPTITIETSPNHFHALWRLDREMSPARLARLNKALSYALDADRGGWDLTQVLRVPGTRNFKYGKGTDAPMVGVKSYDPDMIYSPANVWAKIKRVMPIEDLKHGLEMTAALPLRPIKPKIRRMLRAKSEEVVEGERSDRLWEIECSLVESGLKEDEIFPLVWNSAWNKYRATGTGQAQLKREIHKAYLKISRQEALKHESGRDSVREVGRDDGGSAQQHLPADGGLDDSLGPERIELSTQRFNVLVGKSIRRERWLIDRIWSANAQGVIGGEPKTSKSTIALAMSMAVASGRPFLGKYRVKGEGMPSLFVDCETGEKITQDRARRIGANMGLIDQGDVAYGPDGFPSISAPHPFDIPLITVTQQQFDLSEPSYMDWLRRIVEKEEIGFLVLDPLYLMLGDVNENQTHSIRPVLNDLSQLRNDSGVAIAIVHHYKKANETNQHQRAGQRLSGSWAVHGWVASSVYCEKKDDTREGWTRVRIETEHRNSSDNHPVELAWTMNESDEDLMGMSWEVGVPQSQAAVKAKQTKTLVELVKANGRMGISVIELAEELDVKKPTIIRRVRNHPEQLEIRKTGTKTGWENRVYYAGKH